MKRTIPVVCLFLAAAAPLFSQDASLAPSGGDTDTVTIIWTANERGRHAGPDSGGSAAAYAAVIEQVRRESPSALLVNLGNFMGPTPATIVSRGAFDFAVMEKLGYDLLRASNHEFVVGEQQLAGRIALSPVPVLAGNLSLPGAAAKKWHLGKSGNRTVGFLSLTSSRFTALVAANTRRGVTLEPFSSYASSAIEEMKGRAELVIALADLDDGELAEARNIEGLDVILNAGSLSGAAASEWIAIAFPDKHKAAVANSRPGIPAVYRVRLRCARDAKTGRWTVRDVQGDVFPVTDSTGSIPEVKQWAEEQVAAIRRDEAAPIGELAAPIGNDGVRDKPSGLGTVVTDLMRHRLRTHLAVLNAGTFRSGLPQGRVTEWDLIEALPYSNRIIVKRLTGAQVEAVIGKARELSGKGGFLQWSGLDAEHGNLVAGAEISSERVYTVALNDFLAQGGDGYEVFEKAPTVRETDFTVQDLVRDHFRVYGALVTPDLPRDDELNFWFGAFKTSGCANAIIAPGGNAKHYPNQSTLSGTQSVNAAAATRLEVNRRSFVWGWDNYLEAEYGLNWDKDWECSESGDTLTAGTQLTLYTSRFLFQGAFSLDPYLSGVFATAMIYPGPGEEDDDPRPGELKFAGGLEINFLERFKFKFGCRVQFQPFDDEKEPETGLEGILEFSLDLVPGILSFTSKTDVFSSFDWVHGGVNIATVNSLTISLSEYLKTGPSLTLFYNTVEEYLAYIVNVSLSTEFKF